MTEKLLLNGICKTFAGNVCAASDVCLTVNEGDFVTFVGPSGCGKTTVLRMIAGLEIPDSGEIFIDGRDVTSLAAKNRDVAMIFQDYALYPHMSVWQNIAFPLRMHKTPKADIEKRVLEIAASLELDGLLERKPSALSGGQRQRVAIARALVRNPSLCLMDEPFSNLDAKLRMQMRSELARIHREFDMTVIFVTHDQSEAMALGTKVVVLKDGIVQQVDAPQDLYQKPRNAFVGAFIGSPQMNTFNAMLVYDNASIQLNFLDGSKLQIPNLNAHLNALTFLEPAPTAPNDAVVEKEVIVGIRPENITILSQYTSSFINAANNSDAVEASVQYIEILGADSHIHVRLFNEDAILRVGSEHNLCVGQNIACMIDLKNIHLFDATTNERIYAM